MRLTDALQLVGYDSYPDWAEEIEIVHPYTQKPMTLRQEQLDCINQALTSDNHRLGVYSTMGTSTSVISYVYLPVMAMLGNRCLVIMPPKLLRQYERNLYLTMKGLKGRVSTGIYHGTPKKKSQLAGAWYLHGAPDIILTGFVQFREEGMLFRDMIPCDVLVGDEVKWLADPTNQISCVLDAFMGEEGEKAALMMNGTPARTNLLNLYGFIHFISPGIYRNRDQFERIHVLYDSFMTKVRSKSGAMKQRRVYKISGYRNTELLYQNLYHRGRRDVLEDLSAPNVVMTEFDLDDKHHNLYKKLVTEKLLEFDDNTLLDLSEANGLRHLAMRAVSQTDMLRLDKPSQVVETVKEMLEELTPDTKVILGAYYQSTVELLAAELAEYQPAVLYGKVSSAQAEVAKQRFLTDDNCKVAVLNYESGGVGIDGFQNVSNVAISVEPTSIPGDFDQWVARISRPGQIQPVSVFCLKPAGTIYSSTIRDRVRASEDISSVVDRERRISVSELRKELLDEE